MSDQVELQENSLSPSTVDSTAIPTKMDETSKTNDKQGGELNSSGTIENGHSEEPCTGQSIANGNTMDVIVESKVESIEMERENPSVEMETVNKESALDEHKQLTSEQKESPAVDAVVSNDTVCISIAEKDNTADETQESVTQTNAVIIDVETKQQKPPAYVPSIGSLGLLNQYASSSDDDEDSSESSSGSDSCSSSSSESDDSDTEAESDEEDNDDSNAVQNNVEMPTASSAPTDNQLNTMANDILAGVMSRNKYRDASSDT